MAFILLLFASSGIIMNHRQAFSGVDVPRSLLPASYRYNNWNLSAIKGSENTREGHQLIFGNIGVWMTDSTYSHFKNFNQGFPDGIDNRKVSSVLYTENDRLFAGTYFGLYEYDFDQRRWDILELPVEEKRIVDVVEARGKTFVQTRSHIIRINGDQLKMVEVPYPHKTKSVGIFETFWDVHSGEILGIPGKLFVDFLGVLFLALGITGLLFTFIPKLVKQKIGGRKLKKMPKPVLKWHNKPGIWFIAFFIMLAFTGMFLRPPFLLFIAGESIEVEVSGDNNPWHDRFRGLVYDKALDRFILGTKEGFYYSDNTFASAPEAFHFEPPVSVMGINVLEVVEGGQYKVGSFTGLYDWIPERNLVMNAITGLPVQQASSFSNPFGSISVAGYIKNKNKAYIFDYSGGAFPLKHRTTFPGMPAQILEESPISLWNLALEVHTGRIFKPFLGKWYILYVPLSGLLILLTIITGLIRWLKTRKKKSQVRT